jgi:hypothetical protein
MKLGQEFSGKNGRLRKRLRSLLVWDLQNCKNFNKISTKSVFIEGITC